MSDTITIKLRKPKAIKLLEDMEDLNLIEITYANIIPKNWSSKKKRQAKKFLSSYREAKLAEQGKIKLKTAQSLIDEL